MSIEQRATRIVTAVLGVLGDRKGFDHWWHNIDDDTKEELLNALTQAVIDDYTK